LLVCFTFGESMRQPADRAAPPASESPTEADAPERRTADAELPAQLAELGVTGAAAEQAAFPALGIARIHYVDLEKRTGDITVSGRLVTAKVDPTVHFSVLKTAEERGEPVLVEQRGAEICIVGALRTQPTPGVDKMSTILLEADRIEIKAKEEITMSSGVAAIAVRAIGEVETYAERIVSRAESVHKIIGRMLRLN